MVQINDTSTIQNDGKGQRAFRTFLRFLWTIVFLAMAGIAFSEGNTIAGVIFAASGILYFLFLNSIIWAISNTIRQWVMPEVFVTANAMDAFKQKVFWNIGPQWIGSLILWIVIYGGVSIWTTGQFGEFKPKGKADAASSTTNNSQSKTSSTEPPPVYPVPQINIPSSSNNQNNTDVTASNPSAAIKPADQTFTKEQIEELERKANYSGDDPVIRARLGLPPKIKD